MQKNVFVRRPASVIHCFASFTHGVTPSDWHKDCSVYYATREYGRRHHRSWGNIVLPTLQRWEDMGGSKYDASRCCSSLIATFQSQELLVYL